MILSPSLLSADFGNLQATLEQLKISGISWVHWDVMDGSFVPNITFGQHVIRQLRKISSLFFDVHLMIDDPGRYIADFRDAGADMLVIHAEADTHIQRTLSEIRRCGMKAGLAFNPATPTECLDYLRDDLDMVLIMSVNPGFGGQKFIPATYGKIQRVREQLAGTDCLIEVDGGVTPENAGDLVRSGTDVLVSGSAFFNHPPFDTRLKAFENACL